MSCISINLFIILYYYIIILLFYYITTICVVHDKNSQSMYNYTVLETILLISVVYFQFYYIHKLIEIKHKIYI